VANYSCEIEGEEGNGIRVPRRFFEEKREKALLLISFFCITNKRLRHVFGQICYGQNDLNN
jgi:hypothetical protein